MPFFFFFPLFFLVVGVGGVAVAGAGKEKSSLCRLVEQKKN